MANLFECGVVIKLLDQVSAPLANMSRSLAKTDAAAAALNAKMSKIHSTFSSGVLMMGGGMALAAPLIMATNEAAKLEKAMTNVKQITRASQEEMERYNPLLTSISHKTAVFSKAMLAEGAAHMAQGGIRTSTDIQKLLPLFSDAADILKITKHVDPNQTFDALTKIAHQMGNFEPNAAMKQTIKDFVTVAQVSPGSVSNFASGGAYVNPLANRLFKIDERSLFALQTTMAQTGGGGKGGLSQAQQMNMLSRSLPGIFGSGLLEGKSAWGLKVLGLTDKQGLSTLKNKDGSFDLMKLSEKFNAFEKLGDTAAGRMQIARIMKENAPMMGKKEGEMKAFADAIIAKQGNVMGSEVTMKAFQYAYGAGAKAAVMLGDTKFKEQMQFQIDRMTTSPSLDKQQKALSKTLSFAEIQAKTDMGSLLADIGARILPHATKMVKAIDLIIFKMDDFVQKHPKITDAIIGLTAAASGLLILGGIGKIIQAGVMGLQFLSGPLIASTGGIVRALAAIAPLGLRLVPLLVVSAPAILAVGAAVASTILVMKNWDKIMDVARVNINYIKVGLVMLADTSNLACLAFKKLGGVIGAVGDFINSTLANLNLPQVQLPKIDQGIMSYVDKRLKEKGWDKDINNFAKMPQPPLMNPKLLIAPKNNVVPFKAPPPPYMPTPKSSVDKTEHHTHVNIAPGAIVVNGANKNPKEVAHETMRQLAKQLQHASNGASGNSVGRPLASNGNYR